MKLSMVDVFTPQKPADTAMGEVTAKSVAAQHWLEFSWTSILNTCFISPLPRCTHCHQFSMHLPHYFLCTYILWGSRIKRIILLAFFLFIFTSVTINLLFCSLLFSLSRKSWSPSFFRLYHVSYM